MTEREERLTDALEEIIRWSVSYPLDIFPEPDLKKAHEVLLDAGMTLDAVSAAAIRRVLRGVAKIAIEAINQAPEVRP